MCQKISALLFFICYFGSYAQNIKGVILDQKSEEPIVGVSVYWQKDLVGVSSNSNGEFEIEVSKQISDTLIISMVGFETQKLTVNELAGDLIRIKLKSEVALNEITIEGDQNTTNSSLFSSINIEKIGTGELRKAACCNLSESFETNATVDVSYSDAATGSKQIQMLGLSGMYSQILFENIPLINGLNVSNGISFVPGTWIESINITKGIGSVSLGSESMSGQINLALFNPENTPKLFVNSYVNSFGRGELNLNTGFKVSKKWKSNVLAHFSGTPIKSDRNNDGFIDLPNGYQANLLNRWSYRGDKMEQQIGLSAYYGSKYGGQMDYLPSMGISDEVYGIGLNNAHIELFSKTGFFLDTSRNNSLGLINQLSFHEMDNHYGLNIYKGRQISTYTNIIYNDIIKNTNHSYTAGGSFKYDRFDERLSDSSFLRNYINPGVFFEYTYKYLHKFSMVIGSRVDYHNQFDFYFSPRIHLKYNPTQNMSLRLGGGLGHRAPNAVADNLSLLVSSRAFKVLEEPELETAFNSGISGLYKFNWLAGEASFGVDYYYTYFLNQLVIDIDKNPQEVNIYNLEGESYSHSLQVEFNFEPIKRFDIKLAYKYYDVKTQNSIGLESKIKIPRHRILANLSYKTRNKKWEFDFTTNWFGKQRLAHTHNNPTEYQMDEYSKDYFLLHAQITKKFKNWELYIGGENLLNFKQQNAILEAENPFGNYFDATQIWGPINGINGYIGMRLTIN